MMTPEKFSEKFSADMEALIPMLAKYADHKGDIKDLLYSFYKAGFVDGKETVEGMLKSVISDIALIVALHVKKDALGLKAALDDFVANRCIVSGATVETRSIH